jgi:hypothetical protein
MKLCQELQKTNKKRARRKSPAQQKTREGSRKKMGGMGMEAEAVALFSGARCGNSEDSGFVLTDF